MLNGLPDMFNVLLTLFRVIIEPTQTWVFYVDVLGDDPRLIVRVMCADHLTHNG